VENEKFLSALGAGLRRSSVIIVMNKDVTDDQIGVVVKKLKDAGLDANISRGIGTNSDRRHW